MGCVYSNGRGNLRVTRTSSNGQLPEAPAIPLNQRSFHVFNVDEHGNEMHEGAIEVTANDLIYKHVNDPLPIYWPLCSLRKYGYNADLFSFVCGRRCPTGPGIYAFKCAQALELFEVLDESLKGISSANMTTAANTSPGGTTGTTIGARNTSNQWPQYRQISNVSLVPCRSPIPLTSNASVTPAVNSSTAAATNHNRTLTSHNTTVNETGAKATTDVDNAKCPAYYVNISTSDAANNQFACAKSSANCTAASQYVNSEAEVFASIQLACSSNCTTTSTATSITMTACSSSTPSNALTNSTIPRESNNCCSENGDKDINSSAMKKCIHSVHPSHVSPDANSNITSKNKRDESLSYILLDLDSNTCNSANSGPGNSVYVTTEPVTPVNRSPKEEMTWTLPDSTLHNSNSNTFKPPYAQIDFEKTDALNTAASIKKM